MERMLPRMIIEKEKEVGATVSTEEQYDMDGVSLYFRDVGLEPLLTAEDEIELAKRIERGREAEASWMNNGLSNSDLNRLQELSEDGWRARERLTEANTRLVIAMAKRYLGQGVSFLDLIQEGNLGLMKAVEKFDWRRGNKFSTYATWWIRQSLTRALADHGKNIRIPIHMNDRIRKLYAVTERLESTLGREPTEGEIAQEMNIPLQKVNDVFEFSRRSKTISLNKPVGEAAETELQDYIEDEVNQDQEIIMGSIFRDELKEFLQECLKPREYRVIELHYGLRDGKTRTLKEVGKFFGLTRERIRQIESEAFSRVRNTRKGRHLLEFIID